MLSWPALLLAPLIALGELSLVYALVTPACADQDAARCTPSPRPRCSSSSP